MSNIAIQMDESIMDTQMDTSEHNTTNSSTNTSNEPVTLIPCEICHRDIPFEQYISHAEDCYVQFQSFMGERTSVSVTTPANATRMAHLMFPRFMNSTQSFGITVDVDMIQHLMNTLMNGNDLDEYEENTNIEDRNGGSVDVGAKNIASCYDVFIHDHDESFVCTICLDESNKDGNVEYAKTTCGHRFCKNCIDIWLRIKHKCPVCQHDFNEE